MVSLWDMLSLLWVASTVGGTLGGALSAGGGFARLSLGLLLGLAMGVLLALGFSFPLREASVAAVPIRGTWGRSRWAGSSTSPPSRTNNLPQRRHPRTAVHTGSRTRPCTR